MKLLAPLFLLLASLALALALPASKKIPTPPASLINSDEIDSSLFIVELYGKPIVEGGKAPQIQNVQNELRTQLLQAGISFKERLNFSVLLNGISMKVDNPRDIQKIANFHSVKTIWPMIEVNPPRVEVHSLKPSQNDITPLMSTALNMTGARRVHESAFKGKGVRVGIIDTGVDYTHPALGGCFGLGCRVEVGHDFVGDEYTGPGLTLPIPDDDPMDLNGHGTHCAGIIGGSAPNGTFIGVAPEVTFGAYRVFGKTGGTASDIIAAAMERAFLDGMDVINLSLGGGSAWAGYPTAVAGDRLSKAGLIVIAAMGNDGVFGLWETSAPAVGNEVIAVASFDNAYYRGRNGILSSGDEIETTYPEALPPAANFSSSIAFLGPDNLEDKLNDGCTDVKTILASHNVTGSSPFVGKTLLFRRGVCGVVNKILLAQKLNASAVIIFNNALGVLSFKLADADISIPYFGMQLSGAQKIFDIVSKQETILSFGQSDMLFSNPTGSKISSFSSWGMGPDLTIKPDIGAPGGLIYSTYPLKLGGYATLSGTSMATPHVVGCAALYLQAKGPTTPLQLRTAFQNSAIPATVPFKTFLDSVARQGSGMINIADAILLTTSVSPGKLSLKESPLIGMTKTSFITVTNTGNSTQKYTVTAKDAVAVSSANPNEPAYNFDAPSTHIIWPMTFTLKPKGKKIVAVFITPNEKLEKKDRWLYSGYIIVTPSSGQAINVPYAGLKGRYSETPMIPSIPGLPYIRKYPGNTAYGFENQTVTFDFKVDRALVVFRIDHPSPNIVLTLRDFKTDEFVGSIGDFNYLGRNSNKPGSVIQNFRWDGTISDRNNKNLRVGAPEGFYRIVMRVEKPTGAWWTKFRFFKRYESWKSAIIVIAVRKTVDSLPFLGLTDQI